MNGRDDYFSTYHPIINFIYFVFVIGASMFFVHPVFLCINFIGVFSYNILLYGCGKTMREGLGFVLPAMLIVAIINPLFNHYGVTILFYLTDGNPVTLESIIYGIALAVMLCEVILWFQCFNKVMTSDKFIYLFGKIIPAFSLILSLCLRFVPCFKSRAKIINNGQKCMGRNLSGKKFTDKMRNGLRMLSILITWSLENSIDTADSMKSRGYGLKGRTSFSIYRFDKRDKLTLGFMLVLASIFIAGWTMGFTSVQYNPWIEIKGIPPTPVSVIVYIAYGVFCLLPIIVDQADNFKWKKRREEAEKAKQKGYRLWT